MTDRFDVNNEATTVTKLIHKAALDRLHNDSASYETDSRKLSDELSSLKVDQLKATLNVMQGNAHDAKEHGVSIVFSQGKWKIDRIGPITNVPVLVLAANSLDDKSTVLEFDDMGQLVEAKCRQTELRR